MEKRTDRKFMLKSESISSALFCRICGFKQPYPQWGEDGKTPSFEICDCCGAEFGYNDATLQTIRNYRYQWLLESATRSDLDREPEQRSLEKQLKQIPERFV